MDSTTIARILWSTTREFGPPAEGISKTRVALANILVKGIVTGFPKPLDPLPDERMDPAWQDCVTAATQAISQPEAPAYAVLAPVKAIGGEDLAHGLAWPTESGSKRNPKIGPLRRKGDDRNWYFETFNSIATNVALTNDGDAAPGLFPRAAALLSAAPVLSVAPAPRRGASFLVFLLALSLGLGSIIVTYAASQLAIGAIDVVLAPQNEAAEPCRSALATAGSEGAATMGPKDACELTWRSAWAAQDALPADATWDRTLGHWLRWAVQAGGTIALIAPLLLSYAAILALILAGGLATRGTWFGALVDTRNRVSLSSVQMLCWTVVLLGSYVVLGTFNIAMLGSAMQGLVLGAEAGNVSAAKAVDDFTGFFPNMDPALWAALGLTVAVSPFLSQIILNQKSRAGGEAGVDYQRAEARPLVRGGPLETNPSQGDARWSDMITGEEVANSDQVDVSRLQFLIITFLLIGGYMVLILRYLGGLDGTQILLASSSHIPIFPSMPPIDGTFLGLLVLSHGGYLAFKALPVTGAGGVTG